MSCIADERDAHEHPQPIALGLHQDLHDDVGRDLVRARRRGPAQNEDEGEESAQDPGCPAAERGPAETAESAA